MNKPNIPPSCSEGRLLRHKQTHEAAAKMSTKVSAKVAAKVSTKKVAGKHDEKLPLSLKRHRKQSVPLKCSSRNTGSGKGF